MNPRPILRRVVWFAAVVFIPFFASAQEFEWRADAPAARGMSAEKLSEMRDALAKVGTTGLLVIRHDRVVMEWYAEGWDANKPHGTASLAKSLIGGMSLAATMNQGLIRPEDLA